MTGTTSLDTEIGKRIGHAATNTSTLSQRVWENQKLTTPTKMAVYRACVISTLLHGSEFWKTYVAQEKRLNVFHLRCVRRILSLSWQDRMANNAVLERAGIPEASAVDWLCTSNGREPHSQAILVLRTREKGR